LIGPAVGPVLAGILLTTGRGTGFSLINVPIGIVAAFLSWSFVPDLIHVKPKRLTGPGIILLITTLLPSSVYFLEEGANKYWFQSREITACFIIAMCSRWQHLSGEN